MQIQVTKNAQVCIECQTFRNQENTAATTRIVLGFTCNKAAEKKYMENGGIIQKKNASNVTAFQDLRQQLTIRATTKSPALIGGGGEGGHFSVSF